MKAIWARSRAELRGRWRATLALAVMVGLVGGIAIAAAAGARRTHSAYPRFLEATNAADILVNPDLGAFTELDFDAVAALPEVASMGTVGGMVVAFPGPGGEPVLDRSLPLSLAPVDDRTFATLERPQLLAGRLPDPSRLDEAFVNPTLADQRGLRPGDALDVLVAPVEELYAAEESGQPLPQFEPRRLTITGIGVSGDEIVTDEAFADDGKLGLTPAFYREHPDAVFYWGLFVDLKGDAADVGSFRAGVERLAGDEAIEFQTAAVTSTTVQRAIRPQAVALAIFAALAGLAGTLVAAQALARQLGADAGDAPALHAVGMSRRQRLAVALVRVGVVGLAGAVVAGVVAVALSPLFPVGPARLAEPNPGVAVDPSALGLGAASLLVMVVACSAVPAWRSATVRSLRPAAEAGGGRPSRLAGALSRVGARLPAVVGVKLALEPGRGRTSVATRSALVGASLAVAGVVAAVTFAASLDHLLTTPRLYGWNWDVVIEGGDGSDEALAEAIGTVAASLADDPGVSALSMGNVGRVVLAGTPVPAVGVDPIRGALSPTIVHGRAPVADGEVALGSRTLERLELSVGDVVTAEENGGGTTTELKVVGQAVFPNFATYSGSDNTELGLGALVTTAGLARFGPEFTKPFLLIELVEGADPASLLDADEAGLLELVDAPQLPADVVNFDRVRETPMALAALLAALAFATVTHTLVTSVRRRRRDLALIRALGFLRRQVSATIAWQATTVAAVALLVGLPLGVAAGRWAWTLLAEGLGIPPEPVTPLVALALAVPAVLVVANLVAALPARSAGRIRPALALRSE